MNVRSQWLTASPLWDDFLSRPDALEFRQPLLMRFASDKFMDDLQGILAKNPTQIRDRIAQAETWRAPAVGVAPDWISSGSKQSPATPNSAGSGQDSPPFKLFQPVHGNFYVVAGSLTCRLPGLPDHRIKPQQGEKVSLVLRRLVPRPGFTNADCRVYDLTKSPIKCDEFAWIGQGPKGVWGPATPDRIADGEEHLPSFQMPFQFKNCARQLFAAVIPVGRREAYVAGRQTTDSGTNDDQSPNDARKIEWQRQVLDPWGDLVQWYEQQNPPTDPSDTADPVNIATLQASAIIFLDFANFLKSYLPDVWSAVTTSTATGLSPKASIVYASLGTQPSTRPSLLQSLQNANQHESDINSGQFTPSRSDFTLLTDTLLRTLIDKGGDGTRLINEQMNAALDEAGKVVPPTIRVPAMNPQAPVGDSYYILRFTYEQPQCGAKAPVMSDPSQPFQLASYFDPDAPGRPIQVALPLDTSPAALRKYDKNVAFMISDQLAKQMSRVQGLKQLMAGSMGPELGIGMICSFSIPIITICAMILLMIFVILLNIIFFWLPFFKICFPVPTLKAK